MEQPLDVNHWLGRFGGRIVPVKLAVRPLGVCVAGVDPALGQDLRAGEQWESRNGPFQDLDGLLGDSPRVVQLGHAVGHLHAA